MEAKLSSAKLDIIREQLLALLSQPRVVSSGISFDRAELLLTLEQLGFREDYPNLELLMDEAIAQLVTDGKLKAMGNRFAAAG